PPRRAAATHSTLPRRRRAAPAPPASAAITGSRLSPAIRLARRRGLAYGPPQPPATPARSRQLTRCLSVVMPCYNEASTVKSVVERVLESPYVHELIIVDDGS